MSGPERSGEHRMTMRVYRARADGTVTDERAEVVVVVEWGAPVPLRLAYPPCECPRCRHDQGKRTHHRVAGLPWAAAPGPAEVPREDPSQ